MSIIIVWHQFWVHWPAIKNVSCASRAGCCWGWNRESKFQNELSTKLLVGISENLTKTKIPLYWIAPTLHIHYNFEWFWYQSNTYPISKKICLNCALTFIKGWRWPDVGIIPCASKLYGLNCFVFQEPLKNKQSSRVSSQKT